MSFYEKNHTYPFLDQLDHEDLTALLPFIQEREHVDGDILLAKGETASCCHIILSGSISTYWDEASPVSMANLARGRLIGSLSCITGESSQATYHVMGTARTLEIAPRGVIELMNRSKPFCEQITQALMNRIENTSELGNHQASSMSRSSQLDQMRESRLGSLVGSSVFMQQVREWVHQYAAEDGPLFIMGENGVGKCHLACEIHYRSNRALHGIIVVDASSYQAEDWEAMVRRDEGGTVVLEHADLLPTDLLYGLIQTSGKARMIMTGNTYPDGINTPCIEMIPLRSRSEDIPELVYELLRREGVTDPKAAISEEAMRLIQLFPYLGDNIDGMQRVLKEALVRSDRKQIRNLHLRFERERKPGMRPTIGLALGSGSVRGAAHVGVLKVLEDEQIPVDLIAGSSVGAFIGALYAGGQPISAFEKVLPTVRWRQLVHFTLPILAFADNRRMSRFVEQYIGPIKFDELPIPFAVTAADASIGEAVILNTGKVSEAICASTAIPGIMKPVRYQGRSLIDGGVVHPVPVALARSMGADIVIAVDLSTSSYAKQSSKSFVATILNTIEMMSEHILREELHLADIVVNPRLDTQDHTFKSSAAYIAEGVRVIRQEVTSIKRKLYTMSVQGE